MKKLLGLNPIPFLIIIAGGLVIYQGFSKNARWERLEAGVSVKGEVMDAKIESSKKGGTRFFFRVRYYPTPNAPLGEWFPVSEARYYAHVTKDSLGSVKVVHRAVEVRYNPADPREGYVIGEGPGRPLSRTVWTLGGLALIALGGWILRNLLRAQTLVQDVSAKEAVKSGVLKTIRQMFRGS